MATKAEKLFQKGQAQLHKGKPKKAWGYFRKACDHARDQPQLWAARAEAAIAIEDRKDAAESLFYLADLYAGKGELADALATGRRVLTIDPKHPLADRFCRTLERQIAAEALAEPSPEPATLEPAGQLEAMALASPESAGQPEKYEQLPEDEPQLDAELQPAAEQAPRPQIPPVPRAKREPDGPSAVASGPSSLSPVVRQVPRNGERSREHRIGPATGQLALEELQLGEVLTIRPGSDGSELEIEIDDEQEVDVVRAVAATLTDSPLLSELDSELVKRLVDCGRLVHCSAGELVFAEGDTGTNLYLILKGAVAVERAVDEEIHRLATLRAGAFFGEMALLTNATRSADVRAMTRIDLLEISRAAIRELIEQDNRILKLMMRFFRARLVGNLLATSSLFESFSREEKRAVIKRFRLREVHPGHLVVKKGEPAAGLYMVLVGRLQVFVGGAISDPKVLGTLGPGDVFGEMSLLDDTGAMANIRTQGRSWVLLLPREEFRELSEEHPEMREQLQAVADQRRVENQAVLEAGQVPAPAASVKPI
jgi:CRP-like cAMP-binding protein/tetratricopeptide (TPR) repeat protein